MRRAIVLLLAALVVTVNSAPPVRAADPPASWQGPVYSDPQKITVTIDPSRTFPAGTTMTFTVQNQTDIHTGTILDDMLKWMGWSGGYSQEIAMSTEVTVPGGQATLRCVEPSLKILCNDGGIAKMLPFKATLVSTLDQGFEVRQDRGANVTIAASPTGVTVGFDMSMMLIEIIIGLAVPIPGVSSLFNEAILATIGSIVEYRFGPLADAAIRLDWGAVGGELTGMFTDLRDAVMSGVVEHAVSADTNLALDASTTLALEKSLRDTGSHLLQQAGDLFGGIERTADLALSVPKVIPFALNVASSFGQTSTATLTGFVPQPTPTPTPVLTPTPAVVLVATPGAGSVSSGFGPDWVTAAESATVTRCLSTETLEGCLARGATNPCAYDTSRFIDQVAIYPPTPPQVGYYFHESWLCDPPTASGMTLLTNDFTRLVNRLPLADSDRTALLDALGEANRSLKVGDPYNDPFLDFKREGVIGAEYKWYFSLTTWPQNSNVQLEVMRGQF